MKNDEIYHQKPINRQNYGFFQKLILYICTQTINTYHYGAEKDRTYKNLMDSGIQKSRIQMKEASEFYNL